MKTIILAGSGHAHLEILKELSKDETATHRFILVSPHRHSYYSGLIPRLITGQIQAEDLTIDSADFAEAKGFKFIEGSVQSFDKSENTVTLTSGLRLQFDLLSLNVGGTPLEVPSESPYETVYLRPFDRFVPKWREIQRICSVCMSPRFIVVGGGAAAVEVATALRIRLNENQAPKSEVHLVSKSARLCESYSEKISAAILKSLMKLKIHVHLGEEVQRIFSAHLILKDESKLEFDSIFVVTPTHPSKMISSKIDSTLRLAPNIFAAGDGVEMLGRPDLPRSGVMAVHQGRHLAKGIRNLLNGRAPTDFVVPNRQLNILISGNRSARLVWGSFSIEGRWPFRFKNLIDERYMNKFR